MPFYRPKLDIPACVRNLDLDVSRSGCGYPSNAALGQTVARNDRCLHAHLRRAGGYSFVIGDLPRVGTCCGTVFGPWFWPGTPGIEVLKVTLRAQISIGDKMYLSGWSGVTPATVNVDDSVEIVGTGAVKSYAVEIPIRPGAQKFGLVLVGKLTSPGTWNNLNGHTFNSVRGDNGDFAAFGNQTAIQLRNGWGNESGWFQVVGIEDSGIAGAVNDIAYVCPNVGANPGFGQWWGNYAWKEWRSASVSYADLTSITVDEQPLSGSLADAAGEGGGGKAFAPVSDNITFSKSRFLPGPWAITTNNQAHFAETRGHVCIWDPFVDAAIGNVLPGATDYIGTWVFDSVPTEDVLQVVPVFTCPGGMFERRIWIYWRVITETPSGGNRQDGDSYQETRWIMPGQPVPGVPRGTPSTLIPFTWPRDEYDTLNESFAMPMGHAVDSGLVAANRVLRFQAYAVAPNLAAAPGSVYLRGLYVFGIKP